jgi:hypothetical protein
MKLSEVFRLARSMIESAPSPQECPFICRAIYRLQFVSAYDRTRALDIIQNRLFPSRTVEGWIGRRLPKDLKIATDKDFREFRIRWLKALEEEFKQKGD